MKSSSSDEPSPTSLQHWTHEDQQEALKTMGWGLVQSLGSDAFWIDRSGRTYRFGAEAIEHIKQFDNALARKALRILLINKLQGN